MAEVSGSGGVSAVVGPARAQTDLEVKVTGALIGLAVVLAAFVVTWAAQGASRPPRYWQLAFTELEAAAQDFQAHLATRAELNTPPVSVPVLYPDRTAPGITATMHQGFAPRAPALQAPSVEAW